MKKNERKGKMWEVIGRRTGEDLFDCDNHLRRNSKWEEPKQRECECEKKEKNEINIHFIFSDNKNNVIIKKCLHRYSSSKLIFSSSQRPLSSLLLCFLSIRSIHFDKDVLRLKSVCGQRCPNWATLYKIIFVLYRTA